MHPLDRSRFVATKMRVKVVLFCLPLALLFVGSTVSGFNINVNEPRTFHGGTGTLFGFSVLGHSVDQDNHIILVGAPSGTAECQRGKLEKPPGALYRCSLSYVEGGRRCTSVCLDNKGNEKYEMSGKTVQDKKEGQFLGVSLTSQPGPNGKVVVCGHKWIDQNRAIQLPNPDDTLYYARGICYSINSTLEEDSVEKIRPCISEYTGDLLSCLGGASAHFAVDKSTLVLGTPGAYSNRGSVVTINGTQIRLISRDAWNYPAENHQYPYLGYSLTSGHFSSLTAVEGVTGAPRFEGLGRVFIFDLHHISVVQELSGEPVNTYFGASVEAVDLNNDEWSDLLVGAPLYTTRQDEGCVYVYVNNGMGELELQVRIKGSNAIGARFGSAIRNAGDLNKDGYADVAIGAPFEDDGSGAVYIYHGASYGLNSKYSQRIPGEKFDLKSFGSSLSGALDLDANEYPDLIVGAHQSDSVVYLRARPVVNMEASLDIIRNASALSMVRVHVCLTYSGVNVGRTKDIVYTLRADSQVSSILQSRVYFGSAQSVSTIREKIRLERGVEQCWPYTLTLKDNVKDFLNPIPVQLLYRLGNDTSPMAPMMNPAALNRITRKIIGLGRDCGDDYTCKANLQLENCSYRLISGRDVIYLGADFVVHIAAEVSNLGENAYHARLTIRYPKNVVYGAVETVMSTDKAFGVKCEPISINVSMPYLDCGIGNPLRSNARVSLQVRLDIGSLAPSQTELNIFLSISTNSTEMDASDNEAMIGIPVKILADVTVRGASPDQVVYKQDSDYDSPEYLKSLLDTVKHLSASMRDMKLPAEERPRGSGHGEGQGGQDRDQGVIRINIGATPMAPPDEHVLSGAEGDSSMEPAVNDAVIGPNFVQKFEVANLGPGRIPFRSSINISIPWRTRDGDWLIFITRIEGRDGVQACNTASVLRQQYQDILNHYSAPSSVDNGQDDGVQKGNSEKSGPLRTTFSCVTAQCVALQCQIQPLALAASAVIKVHARLWKHSFLKGDYGLVTMISNMSVQVENPQGLFSQPDEHSPDNGTVNVTVSADEIQAVELPIPGWVIPVSVCLGILLLVLIVAILAKLGFFHRNRVGDMKETLAQETEEQHVAQDKKNKAANEMGQTD